MNKENYIFQYQKKTLKIFNDNREMPLGKIYCVGKNYLDHVMEMNDSDFNEPPFYFTKLEQSITQEKKINFPENTNNLQYEVELVVYLKKKCRNTKINNVGDHILGYSVGIDLTKRDMQNTAKEKRQPWDLSKGFDNSGPVSQIKLFNKIIDQGKIELKHNGKIKQSSDISKMIWPIKKIISNLSQQVTLYPGDAIFTGTPSGVGRVKKNDILEATIENVGKLEVKFV
ncbi:MAG: fumarylacetoacetate hydrolase family protein [SAR86 cluster bacterium]|nr:fumarylacetoacetate hydrolase family protein [SAR86 cluster bacterium]